MANVRVYTKLSTNGRVVGQRAECVYYCLYKKGNAYDTQCLEPFYICTNYSDAVRIMTSLVASDDDTANTNTLNKFLYENVITDYYFVTI